jgi:hypothetical protein
VEVLAFNDGALLTKPKHVKLESETKSGMVVYIGLSWRCGDLLSENVNELS